jgi:hypothetical protein
VHMEGLQLAVALEQLRSEGLEALQTQGQVRPRGVWGRGSGSDSTVDTQASYRCVKDGKPGWL